MTEQTTETIPVEQTTEQTTENETLKANENLPDDTRLWAALQDVSGGTWGGCVYDVDKIVETLKAGKEVLEKK